MANCIPQPQLTERVGVYHRKRTRR